MFTITSTSVKGKATNLNNSGRWKILDKYSISRTATIKFIKMGPLEKLVKIVLLTLFVVLLCDLCYYLDAKNTQKTVIEDLVDVKDFKKLLRTKNNVLVCFINSVKKSANIIKVFEESANSVKGQGTMALIDCSSEAKKLCKKLKVNPDPHILKHYKDGEFHKDYDRRETVSSILNFMRDPTGDMPWEEDSSAAHIVYVPDIAALSKLLRKESLPVMVLFYAPWCGFCKQLKPEYSAAALKLKGHSVLAAIDVNRPENTILKTRFNITGFPTLMYFENGVKKFTYDGENDQQSIINFMKNPTTAPTKPAETSWSSTDSEIVHLTDESFDKVISESNSILVMFYAPWCGHCKRLKPEYEKAADALKQEKISGSLAALDATKETKTAKRFNINGYPTLKYFKDGVFQFDISLREESKIVEFMKNPKEPPPPPPPEKPWSEEQSEVVHLTDETFKSFLKKKKHVLVMFYAPWCGHCKKAKPEFTAAAETFKDDPKIEYAAIDCTAHPSICSHYGVKGYPTIKLFQYFNKEPIQDYSGQRTEKDFVSFMQSFSKKSDTTDQKEQRVGKSASKEYEDWGDFESFKSVIHLSDDSFDAALRKYQSMMVFFYVDGCQGCKALKREYGKSALWVRKQRLPIQLTAFDASLQKNTVKNQNVSKFPVIKYYQNKRFVEDYVAGSSAEDLFAFVDKHSKTTKLKDEL